MLIFDLIFAGKTGLFIGHFPIDSLCLTGNLPIEQPFLEQIFVDLFDDSAILFEDLFSLQHQIFLQR